MRIFVLLYLLVDEHDLLLWRYGLGLGELVETATGLEELKNKKKVFIYLFL